jgi:hypothetical protein
MRRVKSLEAFLQEVEGRKHAPGITDAMIIAARNDGTRRAP